jgi:hypothetical protein
MALLKLGVLRQLLRALPLDLHKLAKVVLADKKLLRAR